MLIKNKGSASVSGSHALKPGKSLKELLLYTKPGLTVSPSHLLFAMDKGGTLADKDLWFDPYGYRSSVLFTQNYFFKW